MIRFLPAFGLGLAIAFVASVIYIIGWEAYLAATGNEFIDNYIAANIEAKREAGLSGAEMDAFMAEMDKMRIAYGNPVFRVPITFTEIFPVGFLIALISAAILRNPKVLPAR
ncbi:DUF4199 domain-containing protein [Parvularcula flava]|uniref:DUF4199 domain-containing protein n=1 Tax=Aquisalinus luteolus TaxID=1566827 RepID=A0A8J3EPL0_9PROT|nr:DUF4199 domain-containing protein [Aquisalinus luteolus]NHK28435.1 DUF4199 domain-containing protein [Aquisalinus luteolus]GGH98468.1 hypothetical protein GCM10011355_22130 [Aquisalinus luteolus]